MEQKRPAKTIQRACVVFLTLLFLCIFAGCDLAGTSKVTNLNLFVSSAEITVGGQFMLSVEPPADENTFWVSSNDEIATVSEGQVTGISEGEAVITVSNGRTMASCKVTVKPLILGVKITYTDANLTVGDTLTLTTDLPNGYEAEWTSSDEAVVTVEKGLVKAVGAGHAEVTVSYLSFSSKCSITVMPLGEEEDTERLLLWSDEFDGDALDEASWEFQTGVQDAYINREDTAYGPWFWGNNELQYYTKDAVSLADGVMTITATRQRDLPNDRQFTSARITTRDRGYWTYGYFEARMKLPLGTGMWPAFWMLPQPEPGMGTNNRYGGWAANGEIDIMEAKGRLPYEVGNTLHFGGNPSTYSPHTVKLSAPISEWHTYGFEWRRDHVAWFVDGEETYRLKNTSWFTSSPLGQDNPSAPFDVPFYLLINLAVGGNYDGGNVPDASFVSAAMEVDYVRVYA